MSKGKKFDKGKPAIDLIPYEAIAGMGMVLHFGKTKYGKANWAKGIEYSRLLAATHRHVGKFLSGENLDEESGLSHIDHALTNLAMLRWMMIHRPDLDDRWTNEFRQTKSNKKTKSRHSKNRRKSR